MNLNDDVFLLAVLLTQNNIKVEVYIRPTSSK